MGHKSRICAVFFDTEKDYEASVNFWSAALGREKQDEGDDKYTTLKGELEVLVQHAGPGHQGMHIDIETDDVEAEVARLEGLGAKKKYSIKDWWVMQAPGGHAFCVVPVYTETWPADATEWE